MQARFIRYITYVIGLLLQPTLCLYSSVPPVSTGQRPSSHVYPRSPINPLKPQPSIPPPSTAPQSFPLPAYLPHVTSGALLPTPGTTPAIYEVQKKIQEQKQQQKQQEELKQQQGTEEIVQLPPDQLPAPMELPAVPSEEELSLRDEDLVQLPIMDTPYVSEDLPGIEESIPADLPNIDEDLPPLDEKPTGEVSKTLPVDVMQVLIETVPLPDSVKDFLSNIHVTDVEFAGVPKDFKDGSAASALVTVYGQTARAKFLTGTASDGQKGKSFMVTAPTTWKLSDMVPNFTALDSFKLTNPTFVVSSLKYIDTRYSTMIEPGFNILATIPLDQLKGPDFLNKFLATLSSKVSGVILHGILRKNINDSVFYVQIPSDLIPNKRISLLDFMQILQLPLPGSVESVFHQIAILSPNVLFRASKTKQDLLIGGKTSIYGKEADAQLTVHKDVATGKEERSFVVKLPPGWRFDEAFPELKNSFNLQFSKAVLVLADYAYTDPELDINVEPGLNFIADIAFKDLKLPSFFSKVENLISSAIKTVHIHAVIKKNIKDSTFTFVIPEDAINPVEVKLSDFIQITKIGLPANIMSVLENIKLELPHISIKTKDKNEEIIIKTAITIYGKKMPAILIMQKNEKGEVGSSFIFALPKEWSLGGNFPDLAKQVPSSPQSPRFIVSNMDYNNDELGVSVVKGLNFIASINISDLPDSPITEVLKRISPVFSDVLLHVVIPEDVSKFRIMFALARLNDKVIYLKNLFNTNSLHMPSSIREQLDTMALIDPEIGFTLDRDIRTAIGLGEAHVKAGAALSGKAVQTYLLMQRHDPAGNDDNPSKIIPNTSFTISLPVDWKFSNSFDNAQYMDAFNIKNSRLVISNFTYKDLLDPDLTVRRGLNFVSDVVLSGPLKIVQEFVDNVIKKMNLALEKTGEFAFSGSIGDSLKNASFSVYIPASIGFDFDEMHAKGTLPFNVPFIKKIMTDTFSASVKGKADAQIETGIRIYPRSQEEPLILRAGTSVGPTEASIYGFMDSMYDPAFGIKWLALGGLGFEIDVDYAILEASMAATGVPLPSGLGIRGLMLLGEGNDRATFDIAGKAKVSSAGKEEFIFDGRVEQLDLTQLVWLFARMVDKKVSLGDIPVFKFEKIALKVVPEDAELAGKKYSQGLYASAWMSLFGLYGGADLSVTPYGIMGKGRFPKIDTPYFRMTASTAQLAEIERQKAAQQAAQAQQQSQQPVITPEVGIEDLPPLESETPVIGGPTFKPIPKPEEEKLHDGPSFDLEITLFKQRAALNGRVEIPFLKLSKEIEADFSISGIKFKTQDKWFDLYQTDFEVLLTKEDAHVKGKMQQSALRKLEELLTQAARDLTKASNKGIDKAEADVNAARNNLDSLKRQLDDATRRCGK